MTTLLLFVAAVVVTIHAQQQLDLTLFKENTEGAQCLDGSPAGFYYSSPPSGSSDLWIIDLQGGGACFTEASCMSRANSSLGSSNYWSKTISSAYKILSNDATTNPDFYSGHHVHVPYCNGDVWTGQRSTPSTNPDTWGLYFSGHLVFESVMKYLSYNMPNNKNGEKVSLLDAQYILLTGSSAGGMGTFMNINWLYDEYKRVGKFADNVTIKAAPVAGWFFPGNTTDQPSNPMMPPNDFPHWVAHQTGGEGHNDSINELWDGYTDPTCAKALGSEEEWHCGSVHNLYPFIEPPIFVLENRYDTNQIKAQMLMPGNIVNNETIGYVEYYGVDMERSIITQLVDNKNDKNGLFFPSCFDHGSGLQIASQPSASTKVNGYNSTELLGDWFWERNELPHLVYDTCNTDANQLPCNPTCDPYPPK